MYSGLGGPTVEGGGGGSLVVYSESGTWGEGGVINLLTGLGGGVGGV